MWLALWVTAVLGGCLHEASATCGNGGVCPPGLLCVDTESSTTDGKICAAGTCGNGRLDQGEICDDGNNRSGDGCPADCTEPCGDGVRDPGEVCDDGNTVDGDGCSGDCLALDGIFRISPPVVAFTATEGDPIPPAVFVDVRLQFSGDSVVAGNRPSDLPPTWLTISEGPTTATTAELELRVTDTSFVGTRSTTLRLTISHMNGSAPEAFDVPVSYRIEPSDLALEAMPSSLAFTAAVDDIVMPSRPVDLTFNGPGVTLLAAPSWATISAPLPAMSSSILVTINDTSLAAGTVLSDDIVFATTRDAVQRRATVHVSYHVIEPPALAVGAAPDALAFTALAGGSVPPSQTVDVTFTGTTLALMSAPSWVTVSSLSIPGQSRASFVVSVNDTSYASGTMLSGDIVFRTARGSSQQSATVHVDYRVVTPEVQFVAPYVGAAGRPGTMHIRGRGFAVSGPVTVGVGDIIIGPISPESDTQITVSYPALPEGRYPVNLLDPPGIAPGAPELVIVTAPHLAYQAIDTASPFTRVVYDAERHAIYGVNQLRQIEHFAYTDGSWSTLTPHVVSLLTDIAMAPGGRSLIVTNHTAIHEMSLSDGLFTLAERAHIPQNPRALDTHLAEAAAANNGKVLVLSWYNGSGPGSAYVYDMLDHTLIEGDRLYGGHCGASADGSHVFVGEDSGGGPIQVYDALANVMSPSLARLALYRVSVSADASHVILNDALVYDRSLRLLGNIPHHGHVLQGYAIISHDSSRAFIYVQEFTIARLEIYDLNAPLEPGAFYPLLRSVTLPDLVGTFNYPYVAMTSDPDDTTVFISGDLKLLVVPVDFVPPPDLAVAATPPTLAFTATAGDAIPASQAVNVTYTGASVEAVSAPSWVTVTSPPAPVTSPASFAVAVNTTSFAGATELSGDVVFRTTRGSEQRSTTVHLDYHVLAPPEVQFVAPYVGIAGRPGTVRIRGRGFPASSTVTVSVGDLVIGPMIPDSDTQITVSYPALPEGRYPVALVHPVGIAPRAPELVIVTPPSFTYQAISTAGALTRLVYDAERQAIYGVSWLSQVEHFVYTDGSWSTLSPHVVSELTSIAMAPGGRSLIVTNRTAINEMSLSDGLFTLEERAHIPQTPQAYYTYFADAAAANNGKVLVLSGFMGSGFAPAYVYDMLDHTLIEGTRLYGGRCGGSADGSRIYVGEDSGPVRVYDSLSNVMFPTPTWLALFRVSVSADASRVILNDEHVYNSSLQLTGNIPYHGRPLHGYGLISRDSSRAFMYVQEFGPARLEIYDLNGPLEPGAFYPLLRRVALPDRASSLDYLYVTMASTPDDATVFISGDAKLLVVPVN